MPAKTKTVPNMVGDLGQFFDELDAWRKHMHAHKDYDHCAGVSFYIGRSLWKIRVYGILSTDKAARIQRRAKEFFPGAVVTAGLGWEFYNVNIYLNL